MTEIGRMYKGLLERQRKPKKRDAEKVIRNHTIEAEVLFKKLEDKNLSGPSRFYSEHRLHLLLNHPNFPAQFDDLNLL